MQPDRSPRARSTPIALAMALAVSSVTTLTAPLLAQGLPVPGPELFAAPPETPMEFWDAADYLVRSGQAKLAVPYLTGFLNSKPDDATLLRIRDQFGIGSILRLQDDPATAQFTQPLLQQVAAASRRRATDPQRIETAINLLTRTQAEQKVGVDRLRQAGPYAIPALIRRLGDPSISADDRALIVSNMGRLESSAVPPLVASLDAPKPAVASDAAEVLGLIGDRRAIPHLTFEAARPDVSGALQDTAKRAIERISGRPFEAQPLSPQALLTASAWQYHRHQVRFPADTVELWVWQGDAPAPVTVSRSQAEEQLGLRLAREALTLEPANREAQMALVSLALEKASERFGGPSVLERQDPDGSFALALASGPEVLTGVLRRAIDEGHSALAVSAVVALARVTDRDALAVDGRINPLVEALSAPDRRVQFASAAALVHLEPQKTFPGASRVVPTLARFASMEREPLAVVIDGNTIRAGNAVDNLKALGYNAQVARTGRDGFDLAAQSAEVELVLLDPIGLDGPWGWVDTITNLRADARTAGLPILVVGDQKFGDKIAPTLSRYPRTGFVIIAPGQPDTLKTQLDRLLGEMGAQPSLSDQERAQYASAASTLLARISAETNSPFEGTIPLAEPALSRALNNPNTASSAAQALSDVPVADAQRSLATLALDSGQPAELRASAALHLARSVQRFGSLVTDEEERRLLDMATSEPDPSLRVSASAVVGALRPDSKAIGDRLRSFSPPPVTTPEPPAEPAAPAPGDVPPPAANP